MKTHYTQKEKAEQFYKLHHSGKLLILPNIWEPLGALMLEDLDYPAVATSSSAAALTNGLRDGENLPFKDLLYQLQKIAQVVSVPVTADVEKAYADNDTQLEENIEALIDTGIAGINFEDSDRKTNKLLPIDEQCKKIQLIKSAAKKKGIPLFINARIDTYVHGDNFTHEEKLQETLKRGEAYKNAGADCIFPILLKDAEHINTITEQLNIPLNIMTIPGVPDFKTLKELGVTRISFGSSFLKIAIKAMKDAAAKFRNESGMEEITKNNITSDYLNMLIDKNKK